MGGGHLDDRVVHWQRVHSIVLLPLVSKCPKTIEVCMWCMFVFYVCCGDCVGVCGNAWSVEVCLCKGCDGCCVCIVSCGAVGDCVWEV